MKRQNILIGTVLTMLLALQTSTVDTLFPGIPDMRADFAVDAGSAQLSMSAFVYAFAAMQLIYGPLSDRFGRKPVLLWSMSLFTLACCLSSVAGSFETLVISRVLQGIGAGAGPAVARAIVRDIYGAETVRSNVELHHGGVRGNRCLQSDRRGRSDGFVGMAVGLWVYGRLWRDHNHSRLV